MPSIGRRWKKFLVCSCSHGSCEDPAAIAALLKFKSQYRPDFTAHIGDVHDYTAFRHGAPKTKDEAAALGPDIEAGKSLMLRMEPNLVMLGNHDWRVFNLANHHNAILSYAASCARNEFLETCAKVKARVIDSYDVRKSFYPLGNFLLLHGWKYNENALRDTVLAYGNVMMGHLHSPMMVHGARVDGTVGYCCGMLADEDKLEYSHTRHQTLRHALGFLWGEYSDTYCQVNISQCESGQAKNWKLPL